MLLHSEELQVLGEKVFLKEGVPLPVARSVVRALVKAELDGIPSHGFSRIPFYADQVRSGKIQAAAELRCQRPTPSTVLVDAGNGFAFPALEKALQAATEQAAKNGVSFFAIRNSHHCGVLGHWAEHVAKQGMIGLLFSNTPSAMAPWGGRVPSLGTNPLAFACPRKDNEPIVIDMSLSKVARGKIMTAYRQGSKIPKGWALNNEGKPTTDPQAALKGTMIPVGDAKGAALALMVEILAAAVPGANFAFQATSFFTADGQSPGIGQSGFILAAQTINPFFLAHLEVLCSQILEQAGVRLPGSRRYAQRAQRLAHGITLDDNLYAELKYRLDGGDSHCVI